MFCGKCGSSLAEGYTFCPNCGSPVGSDSSIASSDESMRSETERRNAGFANSEIQNSGQETVQAQTNIPQNQPNNSGKRLLRSILSMLLSILLVGLSAVEIGLIAVQNVMHQDVVDSICHEIDLDYVRVDGVNLTDFIVSNMVTNETFKVIPSDQLESWIAEVLDAEYTRDFLADEAWDYVDDIFHKTGEGGITESDMARYFEKNASRIFRLIDIDITDSEVEFLSKSIQDGMDFSPFSMETIQEQFPSEIRMARWVGSILMPILILAVLCVLVICIILLNRKDLTSAMLYIAIPLMLVGLVYALAGFLCEPMAGAINNLISMGRKNWVIILGAVKEAILTPGVAFLSVGALMTVIANIARVIKRHRKAKAVESQ